MAGFFDQYPRFMETSTTAANLVRLNFRHHIIIEQNKALLAGKRVLDFASHDGRWALAALKAGASYVCGIEPREHLVQNSAENMAAYDVPKSSYQFICGDGYVELERMQREGETFETAMVLGFVYHTAKQYELIERIASLGCKAIIIDTNVIKNVTEPIIRLAFERTDSEANIYASEKAFEIYGTPSVTAVHFMLKAAGFRPTTVVPTVPMIGKDVGDYNGGARFAFIGTRD